MTNQKKIIMKTRKKDLIFVLIIIVMILCHFWTIKELKQDEKNLIDAFRSGQFDEFKKKKQDYFGKK